MNIELEPPHGSMQLMLRDPRVVHQNHRNLISLWPQRLSQVSKARHFPGSTNLLCIFPLIDQINLLDGMEKHGWETHAAFAFHLFCFTTIVVDSVAKPSFPEVWREPCIVVPCGTP